MMSTSRLALFILAAWCIAEASSLAVNSKGDIDESKETDSILSDIGGKGRGGKGGDDGVAPDDSLNPHAWMEVPHHYLTQPATWGEAKEDDRNWEDWMYRQCAEVEEEQEGGGGYHECDKGDVQLSFVVESHGKVCATGWQFKGMSYTPLRCARACFATFGCERFSLSALGDCRVSIGQDNDLQHWPDADMQCEVAKVPTHSSIGHTMYRLVFYHATHVGVYCNAYYTLVHGVNTTAQCAHACKNSRGCRSFSSGAGRVDGGNVHGCRIANCSENAEAATGNNCFEQDQECELPMELTASRMEPGSGYHYTLDRVKSIPEPI